MGFLTAAVPELFVIHLLPIVAIIAIFGVNGLNHSRNFIHYGRGINPVLLNYIGCAILTAFLYSAVIAIGHWTFTPEVAIDESLI